MTRIAERIAIFCVLAAATGNFLGRGFAAEPVRRDRYGDPLPKGALARLGSLRFRYEGGTNALVFSPDGKILAAQVGEEILLWDMTNGRVKRRIAGAVTTEHWSCRRAFDFSRDGKTLAVVGKDHSIGLWHVSNGERLRRLPLPGKVAYGSLLRFSPDGRSLAVTVEQSRVCLLDSTTGKARWQSPDDEKRIICDLAFSPDGKTLAVCPATPSLEMWDPANGKCFRRIDGVDKKCSVECVAFSADGAAVALGLVREREKSLLWDRYILLAKTASGEVLGSLPHGGATRGGIIGLAFTPDGRSLLSCCLDGTIRVWDLKTRKARSTFRGHVQWYLSLHMFHVAMALSPDGKTVALGSDATILYLWDPSTGAAKFPALQGHDTAIQALAFLPDGKTLISSGDSQPMYFWEATSGRQVGQLPARADVLCVSPDGKRLATLARPPHDPETPILWDVEKRTTIARLELEERDWQDSAEIFDGQFAADGKLLVLAGTRKPDNDEKKEEGLLLIRDGVTGRPLRRFVLPGVKPCAMAQPSNGKTTILASEESIIVVDLDRGKTLYTLAGQVEDWFLSFKLSVTERVLCGRQVDGRERMWELLSGQEIQAPPASKRGHGLPAALDLLRRPLKHGNDALCAASSPDGRRWATGLANGSILIWDASSASSDPRPVKPLTEAELRASWGDLAASDASKEHRAIDRLTAAPRQAVTLLREHLRAAQPPDAKHIRRLLADLDSGSFAERERATQELQKQLDLAERFLKEELTNRPSLDVRKRIEHLLETASGPVTYSEQLRLLRSVEVLERIGSLEARRVLESLTRGAPEARLTREAKASLHRMSRRYAATP
jgi:WD40 repeat protein